MSEKDNEEKVTTDDATISLFSEDEVEKWYDPHWQNMPEYTHEDLSAWKKVIVNFTCREDMENFAKLVGQTVTYQTRSIWYPKAEIGRLITKRYIDDPNSKDA